MKQSERVKVKRVPQDANKIYNRQALRACRTHTHRYIGYGRKGYYIMERYDYHEAVYNDIVDYIRQNIDFANYDTIEDLAEDLYYNLWICDSVTGNGSGSYTFNTWQAEENVCHNLDLLGEALEEFDCGPSYLAENGAEACDVTIRCYLLSSCISEALEDMEDEFDAAHGGENGENK